ncbi:type I inositol 3,4-bisphosphate 4-phosphatase [Ditylenchus destructor]|uniref:Type I inositol 3,4-bisphosphate 4-phosphatase n=1 Tax=Ditylenchus destructor TaxID=166010 RepID=A0AAD4RDU0_9BILA|nr:type I inositol 3,4-bisphosphate 4-phosphatase [Ditylenchus destructor]
MEDDNALDIIRWLFKESTKVDLSGTLTSEHKGDQVEWEAKLRGNLLVLKPINAAIEPLLVVCEKIQVRKCTDAPTTFSLKYGESELVLCATSNEEADKWTLKLATSSHQLVQAELDQTMQWWRDSPVVGRGVPDPHPWNVKELRAYRYASGSISVPSRKIVCTETMFESKLSFIIPLDMVKLFIKWTSELRDDLLGQLWAVRNGAMVEALHNAVRQFNSNIEIYTQSAEFIEAYIGPSFRPSKEKFRMALAPVPTNLHVQYFDINGVRACHTVTSGAVAAAPLRFTNGGLSRIRGKFLSGLETATLDHMNEARYYSRRQTLITAKRQIGELTRRIDTEWHVGAFGKVDKVGVQIFSELKQLYETICDLVNSFPNISNLVDALCEDGFVKLRKSGVNDSLSNQMDSLEAQMISLSSKMTVIDKVNDDTKGRETFEESAKAALNSTLDTLLHLVESLMLGQLLSLIVAFRKSADCQNFFHTQLRSDLLLSQAVTLVTTALLTNLENSAAAMVCPPLVTYFSFLSCYGDERGIMEDMHDIWTNFSNLVQFRFIEAGSSVSQTCIPQIDGYRTDLKVSIPLQSSLMEKLPMKYAAGEWFRVTVSFWNIGINHEATLAASIGDISLEETINRTGLARIESYALAVPTNDSSVITELLAELQKVVAICPSRKNTTIFPRVMALSNALGGMNVISCKSGKDRTAMAVTLEEGRILNQTCGVSQQQTTEVIECLRRDGVRRENCRKNVGKAAYHFSPFQMHFLPTEFRPPSGTYTQMIPS